MFCWMPEGESQLCSHASAKTLLSDKKLAIAARSCREHGVSFKTGRTKAERSGGLVAWASFDYLFR